MSSEPLEQISTSLRPPSSSSSKEGMGAVFRSVAVMMVSSGSDAAHGLLEPGDVGQLLGGLLREELEQLLGGEPTDRGHAAKGRGLALLGLVGPGEADHLEVTGGQFEADVGGELAGEVLVPLGGLGEEPLV